MCRLCHLNLSGFDATYCYGSYEDTLRDLIHLFKYGGVRTLERPLADLLALALPREQRFHAVVPMPLHWYRRWRRGFNQSELLARRIAARCGLPLLNVVRRRRATATQAGLSNSARRSNVSGAFRVANPSKVKGLRLLLVDDVITTGATAAACSLALKRAGAAHVAVLTLARVDRRPAAPAGSSPTGQSASVGVF